MMRVDRLIKLVSRAAKGKDNLKNGAIGFYNYGFVFKDFDYKSKNSFVIGDGSSKLCSIGALKDVSKKSLEIQGSLKGSRDLLNYNPKFDLYFGGALKTLIPKLEFGGCESLFHVWMFVRTPKGQMFPATFYYGQSGTSIGGWSPDYHTFLYKEHKTFPQEFESIVNFNPFKFSAIELEEFIEALTFALAKVPISDFEGIYDHDLGRKLMGLRSGKPFTKTLKKERKESRTWSYSIKGNDEASNFNWDYIRIKNSFLTSGERKKYSKKIPEDMQRVLIERAYNALVTYAHEKKSRLAFMVLGCFIMLYKGKLTDKLKQTILKYSVWEYEKDQLKKRKDRKERKRFLEEFRERIRKYDETKVVKVSFYSITRVENEKAEKGDTTPIWRQKIDYSIRN